MAIGKFEIKEAKDGGVIFNLKASNGKVILTSEVYASVDSCKKGIESVVKNAATAAVEDQTSFGLTEEACPKFEIFFDTNGDTRFRLKATNGQIIGASEGYKSTKSCLNGIKSVIKNAAEAPITEVDD